MQNENPSLPRQGSCVDPEKCKDCPPDRVCAWACEQGWSAWDVYVQGEWVTENIEWRVETRDPHESPLSDLDSLVSPDSQALMESFG